MQLFSLLQLPRLKSLGYSGSDSTTYGTLLLNWQMAGMLVGGIMYLNQFREGLIDPWLFGNHPMEPPPLPAGYMWSLPLLYVVFAVCVAALYFPCRWYARVRATKRSAWLSYI